MKDLLFQSKNDEVLKKYNNIGNFNGDNRFYSYINQEIENNLNKSSRFIKFIMDYLFSSNNYKHSVEIKKRIPISAILFDTFCILCSIAFIGCLIGGVLTPLITYFKAPTKTHLVLSTAQWIATGFGIFFMIITIFYLVLVFKFRNKNKSLSLQVYVLQKLNTLMKIKRIFGIKSIIKPKKKTNKNHNDVNQNNHKQLEILLFDNGQLLSMQTIWMSIQILNLMSVLFDDQKIAIQLRNMSDYEAESWNNIVINDFVYIELLQSDSERKELPVSNLSYSDANYYGLTNTKSSFLSYLVTLVFAGIFGSTLSSLIIS